MTRFHVIDVEQGSEQWRQARCGLVTASRAADVLAKLKGNGEAAARRDLRTQLVLEKIVGQPLDDGFVSQDMARGTALEADALASYEAATGELLQRVGFLRHNTLDAGYSPDGVIGDYVGLAEAKAPRPANHLRTLRNPSVVPPEHVAQLTHALWLTGAAWIDLISYCPQFPEHLQTVVIRLRREDVDLHAYELCVRLFLDECEKEYQDVLALRAERVA